MPFTAPLAAAIVDWQGLGQVVVFAILTGLVIVGAFSFGVVGLDRWSESREDAEATNGAREASRGGHGPASISQAAIPVSVSRPVLAFGSLAMAVAGFGICVVAVILGLLSLIDR